jgi:acetyl esterase/lipase
MIHGGCHIVFSRKHIRPSQTRLLLELGFLPVSLNHRLCPEVKLANDPMVNVCDALKWARNTLPNLKLQCSGIQIDGERVVVVGWSSGGQLAMSLTWSAPIRGLWPPEAILAFYCSTNYEDECKSPPVLRTTAEVLGLTLRVRVEATHPAHWCRRHRCRIHRCRIRRPGSCSRHRNH